MDLPHIKAELKDRIKVGRILTDEVREELIRFLEHDSWNWIFQSKAKEVWDAVTNIVIPYRCYTDIELIEVFDEQRQECEWTDDYSPDDKLTVFEMSNKVTNS